MSNLIHLLKFFPTLFLVVCCSSCKQNSSTADQPAAFIDTGKYFKKEIPFYSNGEPDAFYKLIKLRQRYLGLHSLENGFDGLQIRVWDDTIVINKKKLFVITNSGSTWQAKVFYLQANESDESEKVNVTSVRQVTPKCGWSKFVERILDFGVLTLPDGGKVLHNEGGGDGSTYIVEVASKTQYRFYSYWEPRDYQDKFWQAKNMTDILDLLQDELE